MKGLLKVVGVLAVIAVGVVCIASVVSDYKFWHDDMDVDADYDDFDCYEDPDIAKDFEAEGEATNDVQMA